MVLEVALDRLEPLVRLVVLVPLEVLVDLEDLEELDLLEPRDLMGDLVINTFPVLLQMFVILSF